jgi:hypothetical protein
MRACLPETNHVGVAAAVADRPENHPIAALARQMKLTILTADRDFEAIPDIRMEDWSRT